MVDDVVQEMNKNTNYVYEIYKQILFVNLCLGLFRQKNTTETSELKLAAAISGILYINFEFIKQVFHNFFHNLKLLIYPAHIFLVVVFSDLGVVVLDNPV